MNCGQQLHFLYFLYEAYCLTYCIAVVLYCIVLYCTVLYCTVYLAVTELLSDAEGCFSVWLSKTNSRPRNILLFLAPFRCTLSILISASTFVLFYHQCTTSVLRTNYNYMHNHYICISCCFFFFFTVYIILS